MIRKIMFMYIIMILISFEMVKYRYQKMIGENEKLKKKWKEY